MPDNDQMSHVLSQKVEQQVRTLIGELQMQVIVLRNLLEVAQQQRPPSQQPPVEQPPGPLPEGPAGSTAHRNGRGVAP